MGNIHGHSFRITTFGESHGPALGVVIDGCPPRVPFDAAFLRSELDRRRPGQSALTTQRKEADAPEVLSGVSPDGLTLGSPIAIVIRNGDQRPQAYAEMKAAYRPSHADYTYDAKYGIRDYRGGGRSSARETAMRVAAGGGGGGGATRGSSRSTVAPATAGPATSKKTTTTGLIRALYTPGRVWSDKVECLRRLETVFLDNEITEHISSESLDMLNDALVAEIGDAHYRVSCQAMATLSAAFGCAAVAHHLQHHMEQLVPVLFVRIGDTKECIRTAA